jgi:dolichyl-diphosphooligosaccharide--protein glycosyltransferase
MDTTGGTAEAPVRTDTPEAMALRAPARPPGESSGALLVRVARWTALLGVFYAAVSIRLGAVRIYGRVIHEFDPWFNFRATKYLEENGWYKFSTWYDYESWYPLGRPVGTTTYPGMMVTAVAIFRALTWLGVPCSINDVCVFIPAGFAVLTCYFTYRLAFEATRSANVALASAAIMSVLPAHLMRSVAGGFDNESMAVAAICATFFFWTRALRFDTSWPYAFVSALSYIYMVATWGGYTFVLNMIGVHTAVLLLAPDGNGFTRRLHRCYTIWFVVGTAGAVQFPIVGWQPLQSMEQLGPLGVFALLQLMWLVDAVIARYTHWSSAKAARFRRDALALALGVGVVAAASLVPKGFVGPLSARIQGLFVRHTRTGNPLVDSVAEHQATPPTAYIQYFHNICLLGPIGAVALFFSSRRESKIARKFILLYLFLSAYFSGKMIRLVLLLSPAASIAAGYAVAGACGWAFSEVVAPLPTNAEREAQLALRRAADAARAVTTAHEDAVRAELRAKGKRVPPPDLDEFEPVWRELKWEYSQWRLMRKFCAVGVVALLCLMGRSFYTHSWRMAGYLSEPQVMMRTRDGVVIDDFREAYHWLRNKTPEDARVMAWWDYGYQINGIANRTTIADGNTWNHEHIALLGRALVSSEKEGHAIARVRLCVRERAARARGVSVCPPMSL